jgi:hypothetical protein
MTYVTIGRYLAVSVPHEKVDFALAFKHNGQYEPA